ncbi:unnamed protein product [Paramecium sonneborni]|uniref:Uncharacterized protein n=1 Tax=Paramecium sonneborni TaxID=65129 RepID=A0A8S1LTM3_9CILI|nr:unnamed protein product [Paramecium sonneborni]
MGKKEGKWDIMCCKEEEQEYVQIGGGSYDNHEGEKKIGELDQWFDVPNKQITYCGEYNVKGIKVGRWDIVCEGIQIGGGSFEEQNQKKIGSWIELDEKYYNLRKLTYNGEYNIQGMKAGRWNIVFEGKQIQLYNSKHLLAAVDHIIVMRVRKRLECGQSWMNGLPIGNKSLIIVNII